MSHFSFFSHSAASPSTEHPPQPATAAPSAESRDAASSSDEGEDDLDVEDLLWAAQMDLIGHRHPQAIAKLQQAVSLRSSGACATLGNLLSRGLRGEHLSNSSSPPEVSPPLPVASGSTSKRPAVLRTMTTPQTQAASHEDSLAAAKLFIKGLEFELEKPVEAQVEAAKMPRFDESDAEDGAEGRYFNLERALDLVVGLTDSYRFGVLHPPDEDRSSADDDLWARGAAAAQQILLHPAITLPPPLTSSLSLPPMSSSPRSRSVSRSYAHPSMTLPPPATDSHPHPHLSATTKLRITISVHALYLLALQAWPTNKDMAEGFWRDIISVGSSGVGTKEGEEVVERAKRRLEVIHHKEGPNEAWHQAKQKGRGRKARRGATTGTVGIDALEGKAGDALSDIWREKREKEELWKANALGSSPPPTKVDRKGKGKATSHTQSLSSSFVESSAITIRANGDHSGQPSRGNSSLSTSTLSASRTPRPSKFHFAPEPTNDYPSPPDTPGQSPVLGSQSLQETPHEGHGIVGVSSLTNTIATEEPESYFPPQPSTSPDTSISTSRSVGGRGSDRIKSNVRRMGSRSSLASTSMHSPSSMLLSRVRSSASVSTLPPDFGSTRAHSPWSRDSTETTQSISFEGATGQQSAQCGRARSHTHTSSQQSGAAGWRSGWKHRLSSLKESSSWIIEGFSLSSVKEGSTPSAADVLREVLVKDDESAGPGMMWADRDEDELETDPEGEYEEGTAPVASTSKVPLDGDDFLAPPHPIASTSSSPGPQSPGRLSPKTSKPRLQRVSSNHNTRSFVDVTSAEPRYTQPLTNPPTPERGSRSASLIAASQRRSFSSPNLPGAPVDMDPLLVELERKSRVGVKTVCTSCGKKGLNFPKSRGGQTYCSRECRVKGIKVRDDMEERGKKASAATVTVAS